MNEVFHPLKSEACDWLYRLLGLCFIEDNLGKELEKDPKTREMLKKCKKSAVESLRDLCRVAKQNEDLRNDEMFQMLERIFDKNQSVSDIEKAKKLLESKGYRIEKK